jgi:micrococcal nuclease
MRTLAFVILMLHARPANGQSTPCKQSITEIDCVEYVRNYDGDTITVNIAGLHPLFGREIPVRVFGIDAPEIKGKGECERDAAKSARDLLGTLLKSAKKIELRNVQRDKYFRILAEVFVDGGGVHSMLLARGLAYQYHGGTKQHVNWCDIKHMVAR